MPPPETPSPKSPPTQQPTDEPRSRKPSRASDAATPSGSASPPAQIAVEWSEVAASTLKTYDWENADQRGLHANATLAHSHGAKRACNLVARQAIQLALQSAQPLYPALDSHLEAMRVPAQWHLDLQWIGDAEMQEINLDTRGKDKPTDVLSFPVWEGETFPMPPEQSEVMLGDLVISIETAIAQAAELKHDLRAEIAFLAAHGTLHLLGYDHGTDSERRKMFALQEEIVAQLREAKGF